MLGRRRGITGLQGLDDDDDEEEQEERGGKGKEDDLKGIIIGGDMKEVPGEEEEDDEDEDEEGADAEAGEEGTEPDMDPPVVRQTLIFSATLSLEEEMRGGKKAKKPKHKAGKGDGNIVAKIMKQVGAMPSFGTRCGGAAELIRPCLKSDIIRHCCFRWGFVGGLPSSTSAPRLPTPAPSPRALEPEQRRQQQQHLHRPQALAVVRWLCPRDCS